MLSPTSSGSGSSQWNYQWHQQPQGAFNEEASPYPIFNYQPPQTMEYTENVYEMQADSGEESTAVSNDLDDIMNELN